MSVQEHGAGGLSRGDAARWVVAAGLACALLGCGEPSPDAPASVVPFSSVASEPAAPVFHVIAHRGGAGSAPENTLPAFERALAGGFTEVEFDVRRSRDGVLVLFHDRTLEEKTGQPGAVGDYTAAQLQAFDVGSWFDRAHPGGEPFAGTGLITLAQLFRRFGDALVYHVEVKDDDPRTPAEILAQLDAFGLRHRAVVTSFSFEQLVRFRALTTAVPVHWLLDRSEELEGGALLAVQRAQVDRAADAGFEGVAIRAAEMSASLVDYAESRGLFVRAWGVRSEADVTRLLEAGSQGATTDWPEALRARAMAQRR